MLKIAVTIPSRGRPRQLAALLTSLQLCESPYPGRQHEVHYIVACDEDDPDTIAMCKSIHEETTRTWRIPLSYSVNPRPSSLGSLLNDMAELLPADVYAAIADDTICITPYWDKAIADAVTKLPWGVFWWKAGYPEVSPLYPIITEQWRKAAGSLYTLDYPFWWDDLCLAEIWNMATDQDCLPLNIMLVDKPYKTIRMRDLWFWREFWMFTRPMRVRQAFDIAARLSLPVPKKIAESAVIYEKELSGALKAEFDQMEADQGEGGEPDAQYLLIKRRAEIIMSANHKLRLDEPALPAKTEVAADTLKNIVAQLKSNPEVQAAFQALSGAQPAPPAAGQ